MLFILFVVIIKKYGEESNYEAPNYIFSPSSCHFLSLVPKYFPLHTTDTLNVHEICGSHASVPKFTILLGCYNWLIITKVVKDHNTSLFSVRQSPPFGLPDV